MTAHILVVGSPDFTDSAAVETVLQRAYLTLSAEFPVLTVMGCPAAETWWLSHGMLVEPPRPFGNKYVTLSNCLRDQVPDLVLVFGDSNLCRTTVDRCAAAEIRHVYIEE